MFVGGSIFSNVNWKVMFIEGYKWLFWMVIYLIFVFKSFFFVFFGFFVDVVYVYLLSFIGVLFLRGYRVGRVFFGKVFVDVV